MPKLELPEHITGYKGGNAKITVQVIGSNPPVSPGNITWRYWNEASNASVLDTNNNKMNTTEDGTGLIITDLTSNDEGYYQILIWHPAGISSKTTYLAVAVESVERERQFYTIYLSTGSTLVVILVVILSISVATVLYLRRKRRNAARSRFEMYN